MTSGRRELIFGTIGLIILGVVAYVLITQATAEPGGDTESPVAEASPSAGSAAARSPTPAFSPTPTPELTATPTPNPQTYVVQPGDTLLSIAQRFNITVEDLSAKNDILDPNNIFAGQKLVLPQPGERVSPSQAPEDEGEVYVVKPGDTLYGISQELDVSVEDLAVLNDITDPTQLYVGRRLKVPERRLTPPTPRPTP